MWQSDFQYYASLTTRDGEAIDEVRLDVDWVPAVRWVDFLCKVASLRDNARTATRVIDPIWSADGEPPYVDGVTIRPDGLTDLEPVTFPVTYFADAAITASLRLVASGAMVAGQRFDYFVYALKDARAQIHGNTQSDTDFEVIAVDDLPMVEGARLAPLLARAESESGIDATLAETMPTFIARRVLDEVVDLARASGEVETGGILVGNLIRDPQGAFYITVNAQIVADHTIATRGSLRFTPATWASVDAAIRLRHSDEIALGWWHHHPFFAPNVRRSNAHDVSSPDRCSVGPIGKSIARCFSNLGMLRCCSASWVKRNRAAICSAGTTGRSIRSSSTRYPTRKHRRAHGQ